MCAWEMHMLNGSREDILQCSVGHYSSTILSQASAHSRVSAHVQGVNVAASIQMYGSYILGTCPCTPKSLSKFKCPWALNYRGHHCTFRVLGIKVVHIGSNYPESPGQS